MCFQMGHSEGCLCDNLGREKTPCIIRTEWIRSQIIITMPASTPDKPVFGRIVPSTHKHAEPTKWRDGATGERLYAVKTAFQGFRFKDGVIYEPKNIYGKEIS